MEIKLKQRLIGAAVLISLIVIFVPMLLRGPVENRVVEVPVEIPPKPFQVVGKKKPDQSAEKIIHSIPEQSSRKPVIAEEKVTEGTAHKIPKKITKPAVVVNKTSTETLSKEPATQSAKFAKQLVKTVDQNAKITKQSVKTELIKESKKNIVELAWVVQVGSFSSSKNALALRDKLRAKGYRTFVESIKTASGKMYRVRVGPELNKAKTEAAQKRLQQQEKLKGKIYKHGQ